MATAGLAVSQPTEVQREARPQRREAEAPHGPQQALYLEARGLSSTCMSKSKRISSEMGQRWRAPGSRAGRRAGLRVSPPRTRSRTKARPTGRPHRAKRPHPGRLSPPPPNPKQGITRNDTGKLDQRFTRAQGTQTPPRSPEWPFQNLSVQATRCEKPDHFEPLIF